MQSCKDILLLVCVCMLMAGCAAARVEQEITVNAPAENIWEVIADFCAIANWHPVVTGCDADGDNVPGNFRILTLVDGSQMLERLDHYSSEDKSYSYAITDGPLPVAGYVSTISVEANGDASSTVSWKSNFDAVGVSNDRADEIISEIYTGGLSQIKNLAENPPK